MFHFLSTRLASLAALAVTVSVVLSVLGCGLSPEDKTFSESTPGEQTFVGYFLSSESNMPYAGLRVSLVNANATGTTGSDGFVTLTSNEIFSGDVEILVTAEWGSASMRIEGIPKQVSDIAFSAVVDTAAELVTLWSADFSPSADSDATPTPEVPDTQPTRVSTPDRQPTAQPRPTSRPRPTSTPSTTPRRCLVCHEDRGGPRCGDRSWEALHRAVYNCRRSSGSQMTGTAFEAARSVRRN